MKRKLIMVVIISVVIIALGIIYVIFINSNDKLETANSSSTRVVSSEDENGEVECEINEEIYFTKRKKCEDNEVKGYASVKRSIEIDGKMHYYTFLGSIEVDKKIDSKEAFEKSSDDPNFYENDPYISKYLLRHSTNEDSLVDTQAIGDKNLLSTSNNTFYIVTEEEPPLCRLNYNNKTMEATGLEDCAKLYKDNVQIDK